VPTAPRDPNSDPIDLVDDVPSGEASRISSKIKYNQADVGGHGHTQTFKRATSVTGHGAIRVRSFHGRLSDEGLAHMDRSINEWLDQHPDIEIKNVTTTVGQWEGKFKEPALIVNVWF
jgi:hypothetical protein